MKEKQYTVKDLIKESENVNILLQINFNEKEETFELEINNKYANLFVNETDNLMKMLLLAQSHMTGSKPSTLLGIFIGEFTKSLEDELDKYIDHDNEE